MSQLIGWVHRDVEAEVREIRREHGCTDLSQEACKIWVRRLITTLAPDWPQYPLTPNQQVLVGSRFNEILQAVRASKEVALPPVNSNS